MHCCARNRYSALAARSKQVDRIDSPTLYAFGTELQAVSGSPREFIEVHAAIPAMHSRARR